LQLYLSGNHKSELGEKGKIRLQQSFRQFLHEFCINYIIEFVEQSRDSLCFWLPQTIPVNCMKEANRITTMNLTRIHSRRIRPGSHDQHWLTSKINLWNQLFRAGNVRHTSASNLFISTEKKLTHFLYQTTNYQALIDQVAVDCYYWNDSILRISMCQASSILQWRYFEHIQAREET
jgi:hypothetical protein